jgi:MoaD family protein
MPVRIEIPTPLREHTAGKTEVEVKGGTVQEALNDLVKQYPTIGPKLFNDGKLRPYINIFLNDEDIRYLDEMQTAVKDGQLVALIPAVAGG